MRHALPADAQRVEAPFPLWWTEAALPDDDLTRLTVLTASTLPWVRHESFYRCWIAEVTDRVDPDLRAAVARALAAWTGAPLAPSTTVTLQRMEPGDLARVHTDHPRLGYEAVRLVVALDGQGRPEDGGRFEVFADARGVQPIWTLAPRRGQGWAFVLGPASHHAVSPCAGARLTAVFHAAHRGNDAAVEAWVRGLFAPLRFDRLGAHLAPLMAEAEATHDDDHTLRAGRVAWALAAWGLADDTVTEGYRRALDPAPLDEAAWPLALAGWATTLIADGFDPARWAALAARAAPSVHDPVRPAWEALLAPHAP
ncbi:MAG: hypothetical protein H6732_15660 [Alphaproteobacteria bacterium]|nr:hypothetical protein [Alphaproteobacteria bacterium]